MDLQQYLNYLANDLLPEFIKVTVQLVIIPTIGIIFKQILDWATKRYLKVLVKYAAQKVPRMIEDFGKKRMDAVLEMASKKWWLKWLSKEDLTVIVEALVIELKTEYQKVFGTNYKI